MTTRTIAYLTVLNYALITALWFAILVLYLRYRRAARAEDALVGLLASVLALDAFKSFVENLYFGVLWAGQYGLAFTWATPWLADPAALLMPKLLNLAVAVSILTIVIRVWIPGEARERRVRRAAEARLRSELEASLAEVRRKEERWQLALAATQDGIWDYDVATDGLWVSPRFEAQLLYAPGSFAKGFTLETLEALVHPEDADALTRALDALRSGSTTSVVLELRLRARDASYRRIAVRAVALRDSAAQVVRIVGANADVTEQRAAEASLAARERTESLGMLAGGIAHDLNSLLTVLRGNAALVREACGPSGVAKSALDDLELAVGNATDLTTRLLAYSGRGRFVVGPLDVSALTSDIARLMRVSTPARVRFTLDFAQGLPMVEADSAQMQQLVLNLLGNAVDAIGDSDGCVAIHTRLETTREPLAPIVSGESPLPPGRYVVLEVSDDGVGMDERTRARLFEPFFSSKAQGRGLGMSAILGILRAHRAGARLETEPGRGTTFRIYFPPCTHAPAPAVSTPDVATLAQRTRPMAAKRPRALLADDEVMLCRLFSRFLGEAGYDVHVVHDGEEALVALREQGATYALVVLDITMPRRSGRDVLEALRSMGETTPVILTSGYATDAMPLDPHTVFLKKPFSAPDLRAILANIAR